MNAERTLPDAGQGPSGAVLVVGGGVAGVQSALDLTELGYRVFLVEKGAAIGGVMARLDKTFPTNDCSLCILAPKLVEAGRDPNIRILTNAELVDLDGEAGRFTARVKRLPRFIDDELCTGCGQCTIYCPSRIADGYNERLCLTHAAHIDYAQAVPASYHIDPRACFRVNYGTCGICSQVCQARAIDFDQKEEVLELDVGAVILAPGFGQVEGDVLARYGWGRYEDVVTALEFERLMCASGPTGGEIVRPSDMRHPRNIAFLQCIGSRDEASGAGYCSSVCCMYAVKEATMAREHDPGVRITLFYMDVRTHGKGFDAARRRAVGEGGLRVVYARPPRVDEVDGKLLLAYVTEDGRHHHELFDMVVLSTGLRAPGDARKLAEAAGIRLNPYGFAATPAMRPLETGRPGVFVAGAFQGPKDIPESVIQASGAAALCSCGLGTARGTRVTRSEYPAERKVEGEEPRIGVFVCHCGINIGGVVDVPAVRDYAATLPNVAYATNNLYTCSQDTQHLITEKIREHRLNRVVVAACTPRTHEPLFQSTLREAGLNRSLFEMANIRDQCSWVHMHEPEAATEKAKDLVRMAVAKARHLKPLPELSLEVIPAALVVGGGVAGLTAALSVAEQGYRCFLVEKKGQLGGRALDLTAGRAGGDPRRSVRELVRRVLDHRRIHVMTSACIEAISGHVGDFSTRVATDNGPRTLKHGVVLIATGGRPYEPTQYLYGSSEAVITQNELEARIVEDPGLFSRIPALAMIQCVGSRGEDLSYCSRVCCGQAVKNALRLKTLNPGLAVYVFYRDMRTHGFLEDDYREARRRGVVFLRYSPERPPRVTRGRSKRAPLKVRAVDRLLGEEIEIPVGMLVLSVGIVPEDVEELSRMLKVPLTRDGFFLEAHAKLRPVDLAVDGVYVCGLAHSPQFVSEAVAQALAASARACRPLAKGRIEPEPITAQVDQDRCIGCGACAEFCPYKAVEMVRAGRRRKARVVAASCKGCGICAARCPAMAVEMGRFTEGAIRAQIHALAG